MPRFSPPPPQGVTALADLDDVDVTAHDGLTAGARLTHSADLGLWTPKIPSPFDGLSTPSLPDNWQSAGLGGDYIRGLMGSPTATIYGDKLYATTPYSGGFGTGTDFQSFDLSDGSLTRATINADLSTDGDANSLARIGASLYTWHGDGDGAGCVFGRLLLDTEVWEALPLPSTAGMADRSRAALVALGGQVYYFAGWGNSGSPNLLGRYDPFDQSWEQLSAPVDNLGPEPAAFVEAGGDLYMFVWQANWRYDPAADTWTEIAPWPNATGSSDDAPSAAIYHNGLIYLFRGTELWVYSPSLDAFDLLDTVNPISVTRGSATCSMWNGRIVVASRFNLAIYG